MAATDERLGHREKREHAAGAAFLGAQQVAQPRQVLRLERLRVILESARAGMDRVKVAAERAQRNGKVSAS